MTLFKIKAATIEGKILHREVEAATKDALSTQLEKEGLFPLEIRAGGSFFPLLKTKGHVKSQDLIAFNQGFTTLIRAGIPILDALETLMKSSRSRVLNEALKDSIRDIRSGSTMSEAFAKHPPVFPALYTASVAAGERTGDLIPAVSRYNEYRKKSDAVKKRVIRSITYPTVLALASVFVIIFMIGYVFPSFAKVYTDSGAELPLPTRMFLFATGALRDYFLLFAAAAVAAAAGFFLYFKSHAGRGLLDNVKLKTPQFGDIYRGYAVAKFSRTFAMVLMSGTPIIGALEMSKGVLRNDVLAGKLERIIKRVKEGISCSAAMADEGFFPDISMKMFGAGEKSAALPEVLNEIADYHEDEVSHRVEILMSLIEPALMIVMGLVVGAIVILMYLPIFQLGARF
ncbi:MAG: type II secretion system F family protein [Deltaproteobacteria bacterium]|nr:type II secretion system F family protein [Deltaproteobacteria bacterium]